MITYLLLATAAACFLAAAVSVRSARLRFRVVRLIDDDADRDVEAHSLAFSAYRKEAHAAIVYGQPLLGGSTDGGAAAGASVPP